VKNKLLLIVGAVLAGISAMVILVLVAGIGIVAVGAGSSAGGVVAIAAGKGSASESSCTPAAPAGTTGDTVAVGEVGYTEAQIEIVKQIIGVGKGVSIPEKGWIIAVMVAMQESTIQNLDGGDADSLGIMQQRPSTGWGTREQIKNPVYAIQAFYLGVNGNGNPGLMSVPGWDSMPYTQAAQLVQRSAFPDAYAKHEPEAVSLIAKHKDAPLIPVLHSGSLNTTPGNANSGTASSCVGGVTPGGVITAAGDDYPGREWVPDRGSVAGGLARECVDFTAWRMRKLTAGFDASNPFFGTWYQLGNGAQWGASAAAKGYAVDNNPRPGDIAYWMDGGYGHVAFVAEVKEGGKVSLEEYNWIIPGGGGASDYSYHTREINAGEPAGYIHFLDNPGHPMVGTANSQMG
jgi:hypothetical protein